MTADELLATHRRSLPWIIANEIMAGANGFIFAGSSGLWPRHLPFLSPMPGLFEVSAGTAAPVLPA